MIVRDEASVIAPCLESVRGVIDHWAVIDTGSTDGTRDVVRGCLDGIPGVLGESAWMNFGHNRTEALELARGRADYTLLIDADETLNVTTCAADLTCDSYRIERRHGILSYWKKHIVRSSLNWRFIGVAHEYIHADDAVTEGTLDAVRIDCRDGGARSLDPEVRRKEIKLLLDATVREPGNARYAFYLAQTYRDAGDLDEAVRWYARRMDMGGWQEEVWYSLYQIAGLKAAQGSWPESLDLYLKAWQMKPHRAEPLFRIGCWYQHNKEYALSNLFLERAMSVPMPGPDNLFVERAVYDYLAYMELAVSCYYVGDHDGAIRINSALLDNPELPSAFKEKVVANRQFSVDALKGKQ